MPPGAVVVPGTRALAGRVRAGARPGRAGRPASSSIATRAPTPGWRSRRRSGDAAARDGGAGRGRRELPAAAPTAPAAARPPARNEILRATGSAASTRPTSRPGSERRSTSTTSTSSSARSQALRAALPPIVEIAYAVKANPALADRRPPRPPRARRGRRVGRGARDRAAGGDSARSGSSSRVPASATRSSAAAVAAGVRAITVESPGELDRLERIAAEAGRARAGPAARLDRRGRTAGARPAGRRRWGREVRDGRARPAGRGALRRAVAAPRAARAPPVRGVERARRGPPGRPTWPRRSSWRGPWPPTPAVPLRLVDAGGGLGIPYEPHEEPLDVGGLGRRLAALADALGGDAGHARSPAAPGARPLPRRGRPAPMSRGWSTASASARRRSPSSTAASTTCFGRRSSGRSTACGSWAPAPGRPGRGRVTVAGPLCSGLDVFAANARLPVPAVGRPRRGPRRRRVRLHGVDAALPEPRRSRPRSRSAAGGRP